MARPNDADSAVTQQKIEDVAMALINEAGAQGLSLRKVGQRAGLGLGTVQYYFKTKEELVDVCVDRWMERINALLEPQFVALAQSPDPARFLVSLVRPAYRLALANRKLIQLRQIDTASRAGLAPRSMRRFTLPLLNKAGVLLAAKFGGSPAEWRLTLRTFEFLISRHVGFSLQELADTLGYPEGDPEALHAAVEHHLEDLAARVFQPRR